MALACMVFVFEYQLVEYGLYAFVLLTQVRLRLGHCRFRIGLLQLHRRGHVGTQLLQTHVIRQHGLPAAMRVAGRCRGPYI